MGRRSDVRCKIFQYAHTRQRCDVHRVTPADVEGHAGREQHLHALEGIALHRDKLDFNVRILGFESFL